MKFVDFYVIKGNWFPCDVFIANKSLFLLYQVLPPRKAVKPGMVFLFELFLLRGACTWIDREVGWGAFPLCDNNFSALEGKFKCPFLRGHYDSKIDRFKKIENFISQDLDNWLCNLYFQVCILKNQTCWFRHVPQNRFYLSSVSLKINTIFPKSSLPAYPEGMNRK